MAKTVREFREELADREAIKDNILHYARAIDRCDQALLDSTFWPDATVDYEGFHIGEVGEFLAKSVSGNRAHMEQTAHVVGNMLIEIDGDRAKGETYVFAFHRLPFEDGPKDLLLGARYLDRFEKRDDYWKITSRTLIADWFRQFADSGEWEKGFFGLKMTPGVRQPEDRSYRLF